MTRQASGLISNVSSTAASIGRSAARMALAVGMVLSHVLYSFLYFIATPPYASPVHEATMLCTYMHVRSMLYVFGRRLVILQYLPLYPAGC